MIGAALWIALQAHAGAYADGLRAFDEGRLEEAAAAWEAARAEGVPSAAIERGLGRVAWAQEDPARAVAHWRAAARLRPRDADIHHDLALARARLERVPPPVGEPVWWFALATPVEVGLLGALALALASGLAVRWRGGAGGWLGPVAAGAVGLGLAGASAWGMWAEASAPVAVVVGAPAVAREAARPDAAERASFPPGTELRVERRLGDFALMWAANGKGGWVPLAGTFVVGSTPQAR